MQKNNFFSGAILLFLGIFVGFLIWGFNGGGSGSDMATNNLSGDRLVSGMEDSMRDMMSGLEGLSGDEFDEAFLREMITHHQGAVSMANKALITSHKSEILMLSSDIIAGQTSEIEKMNGWLQKWFESKDSNDVMIKIN